MVAIAVEVRFGACVACGEAGEVAVPPEAIGAEPGAPLAMCWRCAHAACEHADGRGLEGVRAASRACRCDDADIYPRPRSAD